MPSSFQPPLGGTDPYEKYRVAEVQKDKGPRDLSEGTEEGKPERQSAFAAYVALVFKKFLELFESTTEQGLAVSAESDVLEHLILFKAALEIMKIEDRSQDAPFLNSLAQHWHQLLDDVLRFRRQTPLSIQMRSCIKQFQQYPENQQHSLGYYLTEYAGQKWLPFPYMEMIYKLHAQHKKNPDTSTLTAWSKSVDELIALLRPPEKQLPSD